MHEMVAPTVEASSKVTTVQQSHKLDSLWKRIPSRSAAAQRLACLKPLKDPQQYENRSQSAK
jgi:hypothetical protein